MLFSIPSTVTQLLVMILLALVTILLSVATFFIKSVYEKFNKLAEDVRLLLIKETSIRSGITAINHRLDSHGRSLERHNRKFDELERRTAEFFEKYDLKQKGSD